MISLILRIGNIIIIIIIRIIRINNLYFGASYILHVVHFKKN